MVVLVPENGIKPMTIQTDGKVSTAITQEAVEGVAFDILPNIGIFPGFRVPLVGIVACGTGHKSHRRLFTLFVIEGEVSLVILISHLAKLSYFSCVNEGTGMEADEHTLTFSAFSLAMTG